MEIYIKNNNNKIKKRRRKIISETEVNITIKKKKQKILENKTEEKQEVIFLKDEVHENHLPEYYKLLELENKKVIENSEIFECMICISQIECGDGITLRECLHSFCKLCLISYIEQNNDIEINCPYKNKEYTCENNLQEREIKGLVNPEVFEKYLNKQFRLAEQRVPLEIRFHCKTVDCMGWCIIDEPINEFICPRCCAVSCVPCEAIHPLIDCKTYKDLLVSTNDEFGSNGFHTRNALAKILYDDSSMRCPQCQILITRIDGCDAIKCASCKLDICWITKGPRWGPRGKGDISGGCRCKVNNQKCHPRCKNCH